MSSKLAVVTVTYSPGEHLEHFLNTLTAATSANPQVVIADNGSTDGAPEAAAAAHDHVRLVRTGGNIGYGGAVNRAVAEIDEDIEFVLVANPDVRWSPGSIDALLAAAERWPRAGAVGPLVREPDGSVYPSARQVPGLVSGAGHALLGKVWPANPWTTRYRQENETLSERAVGWLSGSCLLLRRVAFDSVDGFDSRYFMYMEDVDLGDRLGRAGWLNVFAPGAEVTHAKGHAAGRHPELMLPAHHASAYRFQADRHPHWWQAPLRGALKVGLAVRSRIEVAAAVRERRRSDTGSAQTGSRQTGSTGTNGAGTNGTDTNSPDPGRGN
ncbi:glycosyltransferase family 2 protein [Rhodococcus triatomae]|uniref:N-acetylglucosaminyl-diphospho-decaprenol L-rhamnosyltransferase n=1 Tax=Rhodococcus triatomae TaxID=300028 RepID=A0A1G8FCH9_9NOCA|nr:glycosyltransferase family 2 protein [Rhodococcus triatomae]QNG19448.1 glycosyltransferase family 2 protein [Rhodococcus triatomae]QNG24638.1 glycosyltransferase family 2 protein [Rhodococcus triatomae]SDH79817.1 N-acetylglucosaminyl-diphospho-decaprenol L-rhamnosyltransferase [Rhodococcus triatomae]